MTWQEFGALGEVVGAVAAVALLGYIAYQIRQNSHALELNARSTLASTRQARSWGIRKPSESAASGHRAHDSDRRNGPATRKKVANAIPTNRPPMKRTKMNTSGSAPG